MATLYLLVAILPVYFWGMFIYYKDKNKEPAKLIVKLVIGGVLACFLTLIITAIMQAIIPFLASDYTELDLVSLFVYVLLGIGIIEEFSKWVFSYLFGFKSKEYDESYDVIVYCVMTSLGFAVFENVLYVFNSGITTGLFRIVTAIPGHMSFGIMMGYFMSKAKYCQLTKDNSNYKANMLLSLIVPAFLHTVFDYLIFTGYILGIILYVIFILWMFTYVIKKVNKMANENTPLMINYQSVQYNQAMIPRYCTNCGSPLVNNACPNCNNNLH